MTRGVSCLCRKTKSNQTNKNALNERWRKSKNPNEQKGENEKWSVIIHTCSQSMIQTPRHINWRQRRPYSTWTLTIAALYKHTNGFNVSTRCELYRLFPGRCLLQLKQEVTALSLRAARRPLKVCTAWRAYVMSDEQSPVNILFWGKLISFLWR